VNLSSHLVERVTRLGPPQTRDLALQSRHAPSNVVTNYIFGAVAQGMVMPW
jgi:hypothetical protein